MGTYIYIDVINIWLSFTNKYTKIILSLITLLKDFPYTYFGNLYIAIFRGVILVCTLVYVETKNDPAVNRLECVTGQLNMDESAVWIVSYSRFWASEFWNLWFC
jgi:hypothetical protein